MSSNAHIPTIGFDARWLLRERVSPHAALLKAFLSRNAEQPFRAKFILYGDGKVTVSSLTKAPNVDVRVVRAIPEYIGQMLDDWWVNVALAKAARADRIDAFFSPYYKVPLFLRVPRINMVHDLSYFVLPDELLQSRFRPKARKWHLKRFMMVNCNAAKFTVTVSNYSKGCLQKILKLEPTRIRVCHNGVNLGIAQCTRGLLNELKTRFCLPEEYLLFVGSNIEKKNLQGLLTAFSLLPEDLRVHVPLVLKTSSGSLEIHTKQLGILGQVIIIDEHLSDREVASLIGGARALALLSFDEGFGMPVVEAMAAGVPVVVARGSALEEIVSHSGLLVDPYRPEDAAEALMRILMSTPDKYRQMSERCRAQAEKFSETRAAGCLFSIMKEAIAK